MDESLGYGIRVLCDGAWGFAANSLLTKEDIEKTAAKAVEIARSSATVNIEKANLVPCGIYDDVWFNPYEINPFNIPVSDKVGLLLGIDGILRRDKRIISAECFMDFIDTTKWLGTSEGSFIEQRFMVSGAGYTVDSFLEGEVQKRSFPASFRGRYAQGGYELVESLNLAGSAERVREEAIALLYARNLSASKKDLIIKGDQMALQIHESLGHPSELDRVLGMEANYAGTSFLTTDKKGVFKYGSPAVSIVADGTQPGGLATCGYDDDGVRSKRWNIVKNGIFMNYLTNREFAAKAGDTESFGANRADGWSNIPMIRMTNISLLPGSWELEDLIADTEDGVLYDTNKSWSIDQKRLNFQFTSEIGWEIKNGRLGDIIKNPTYQGITPEFWGSCDAVCNAEYWTLWGVVNCGKGQPLQTAMMSHGASPARFRGVNVGMPV